MRENGPVVSVVVCTATRLAELSRCLLSILSQSLPASDYEIVLVNNAPESDEDVRTLVGGFHAPDRIRCLVEEEEGLSAARNKGIVSSTGSVVAFIDDDAQADQCWLESLLDVYRAHPGAAAVGGRIKLFWDEPVPPWHHAELNGYLGELDYGEVVFRVGERQRLGGGNLSIRRSWLDRCRGFSRQLGRNRRSLLSGEEIELLLRIQSLGGECFYAPGALVHHPAPAARVSKHYLRSRSYWGARSDARIDAMYSNGAVLRSVCGRAVRVPYNWLRSLLYGVIGQPSSAFLWETYGWSCLGYVVEGVQSIAWPRATLQTQPK